MASYLARRGLPVWIKLGGRSGFAAPWKGSVPMSVSSHRLVAGPGAPPPGSGAVSSTLRRRACGWCGRRPRSSNQGGRTSRFPAHRPVLRVSTGLKHRPLLHQENPLWSVCQMTPMSTTGAKVTALLCLLSSKGHVGTKADRARNATCGPSESMGCHGLRNQPELHPWTSGFFNTQDLCCVSVRKCLWP